MTLETTVIDPLDEQLRVLEQDLAMQAKAHDAFAYHLLRSVPGIGRLLALVILYEVEDLQRSILAHRLGRAVYVMLTKRQPFDKARFMATL